MQANGELLDLIRLDNSVNGNPRYQVAALMDDGKYITGKTASDAMYTYRVPSEGQRCAFTWHKTATGRVVFDDIKAL